MMENEALSFVNYTVVSFIAKSKTFENSVVSKREIRYFVFQLRQKNILHASLAIVSLT